MASRAAGVFILSFLFDPPAPALASAVPTLSSVAPQQYPHWPMVRHVDASGRARAVHFIGAGALRYSLAPGHRVAASIHPMHGSRILSLRLRKAHRQGQNAD